MIAARFVHSQLPLNVLTSVLSLVVCAWCVPTFGMQGAAISLLVSKLPYLAIGGWMLWRAERSRLAPRGEPNTHGTLIASNGDSARLAERDGYVPDGYGRAA